ncbi:MAG: hypothetical protein MUP47_03470 [Phycisphaerae bacterium]|nr:hypothetical protein [Phycisphaerae bacterium]
MAGQEGAAKGRPVDLSNFSTDLVVIGLTGALGSGCTYLARGLASHHKYLHCSLSDFIHEVARSAGMEETTKTLQDIGNQCRMHLGRDYLVVHALKKISKAFPSRGGKDRPVGVVVDGIRNKGEIETLQQLPNFYLISVQAETAVRQTRTIGLGKRFRDSQEFEAADTRDRDEHTAYGQQVTECNYLSDIIVINEADVSPDALIPYKEYVARVLYDRYISLIEHVAKGRPPAERPARKEEALMTAAYVESKRSSCLKRKVGAVIASPTGDIIAAAHNDVPSALEPCVRDPRFGRCARDVILESIGKDIKHCPNCGEPVTLSDKCKHCGTEIVSFTTRCPKCLAIVELDYICPKCRKRVFADFLPGGGSGRVGNLLDMCRALHAEENAILNLAKFGVNLPVFDKREPDGHNTRDGCVLYSTTFPCNLCANKIVTVGIRKVVYAEPYPMEEARQVFEREGVTMERFQGVKSRAFFRLYA